MTGELIVTGVVLAFAALFLWQQAKTSRALFNALGLEDKKTSLLGPFPETVDPEQWARAYARDLHEIHYHWFANAIAMGVRERALRDARTESPQVEP